MPYLTKWLRFFSRRSQFISWAFVRVDGVPARPQGVLLLRPGLDDASCVISLLPPYWDGELGSVSSGGKEVGVRRRSWGSRDGSGSLKRSNN